MEPPAAGQGTRFARAARTTPRQLIARLDTSLFGPELASPGRVAFLHRLALGVVVAFAALVRILGLAFGFPLLVHADEPWIVNAAMDMAKRNSFEPTFFDRPDHLEIKLNYIFDTIWSHLRYGLAANVAFEHHYLDFYLIGRSITALFGIACVVLAYLIVRRINPSAGLIAAGLFAFFPPMVVNSHYITPEMPQAALTLLLVLLCMHYLERPRASMVAWMGFTLGAAMTVKYPAIIYGVVIAAVVIAEAIRSRRWLIILTHGAASIGAALAAVAVISPVLLTNITAVLAMVQQQGNPIHPGADGLNWFGSVLFYLGTFLDDGGILLGLVALAGAVWCAWRWGIQTLPWWIGIVYWLAMSGVALHWERWAVPMFISPLLFAAVALQAGLSWVWRLRSERRPVQLVVRGFAGILAGLIAANVVMGMSMQVAQLCAKDTRYVSRSAAKALGVTKKNSIYEGYSPLLPGQAQPVFSYFVVKNGELGVTNRVRGSKQFLVISDLMRQRFLDDPQFVSEQAFYAAVEKTPLVLSVTPVDTTGTSSWIEVANIVASGRTLFDYLTGGLAGPGIYIHDISTVSSTP